MDLPIKLISTDFDGTLYTEGEVPPIPPALETLLAELQSQGVKWVINTGRDLTSLKTALAQTRLSVQPDFLVVVEREIHCLEGDEYRQLVQWNHRCSREQEQLFARIRADLPAVVAWIRKRFSVTLYEDDYSPFCLIAASNADADAILEYLAVCFRDVPELTVVRNDIYARFSHAAYNKGTAMAEVARQLGLEPSQVFAAGDHFNDLPMLSGDHAQWVMAPANAVEEVKALVRRQHGYLSSRPAGHGLAQGLRHFLSVAGGAPAMLK
jgi:HAD superfamily hydrolase (TIGR01484 family)